jgi:hypothetical protein
MVECSTIDHPNFKSGGVFNEYVVDNYTDLTYLCPETGDINIGGLLGTSLWVFPVQNSAEYDFKTDPEPYKKN